MFGWIFLLVAIYKSGEWSKFHSVDTSSWEHDGPLLACRLVDVLRKVCLIDSSPIILIRHTQECLSPPPPPFFFF